MLQVNSGRQQRPLPSRTPRKKSRRPPEETWTPEEEFNGPGSRFSCRRSGLRWRGLTNCALRVIEEPVRVKDELVRPLTRRTSADQVRVRVFQWMSRVGVKVSSDGLRSEDHRPSAFVGDGNTAKV